jgi:hypothetical protein
MMNGTESGGPVGYNIDTDAGRDQLSNNTITVGGPGKIVLGVVALFVLLAII